MRTYPSELLTDIAASSLTPAHLIVVYTSPVQYFTDFREDIYYDGQWYLSEKIEFDAVELSITPAVDRISIRIPNVDKSASALVLSTDTGGTECRIWFCTLDQNLAVRGSAQLIFLGYLDEVEVTRQTARWEVYNHMIKWQTRGPKRNHAPTCGYSFKDIPTRVLGTDTNTYTCIRETTAHAATRPITGAHWSMYYTLSGAGGAAWAAGQHHKPGTCRYEGAETWCDRTAERCTALGNYINFPGCSFISELADAELWWGSKPKTI